MKKTIRFLTQFVCILLIAAMILPMTAFADNGKPGAEDMEGANRMVVAPKDGSWLDEYKTAYIYAPGHGRCAYTYVNSRGSRWNTVTQGTEVTLLAYERNYYLVKAEDGRVFWINDGVLCDHVVAPGRTKSDNAEVDANGPSLNDLKGIREDVDIPSPSQWLDERVEAYVYAPKHHLAAEMFYYKAAPTSQKAIDNGWDYYRMIGTIRQGTKVTLLAHYNHRYLAKSEYGEIFWMYDWCVSDTLVPYGEAK